MRTQRRNDSKKKKHAYISPVSIKQFGLIINDFQINKEDVHTNCCMLHLEMKKFCCHPSTKDIPFNREVVIYPGAPTITKKYLNDTLERERERRESEKKRKSTTIFRNCNVIHGSLLSHAYQAKFSLFSPSFKKLNMIISTSGISNP